MMTAAPGGHSAARARSQLSGIDGPRIQALLTDTEDIFHPRHRCHYSPKAEMLW